MSAEARRSALAAIIRDQRIASQERGEELVEVELRVPRQEVEGHALHRRVEQRDGADRHPRPRPVLADDRERGGHILLFVRERREQAGRTMPYTLLGPADYVSHKGDRPIAFVWRLRRPMPAALFREAKVAAG